jgi:2'-5' RNA ligase
LKFCKENSQPQEYLAIGYFAGIAASDEIETLIESLRDSFVSIEVKTSTPHITLAHLGKQRPDTERFEDIGTSSQPFELSIEGVKIFRNKQTTHLVLPIVQGAGELRLLNSQLRTGGKVPDRNYSPHMSILSAPSDVRGESVEYKEMLKFRNKYKGHVWGRMVVTSFKLFSSTQGVCRVVDQWRLSSGRGVM